MYQVIARKYRPQSFGELIGQEHVQRTLANAIASNRLAHGYIFSGQRGTGKTTVARILARCLNCVNGPTATPCGICSSCKEISAGNSVDVIEIDAASNRGINEMREIRENVRYRPARDRYKVFIIDEAHQITKEAFNALLKTLEEPPEWVVFILCTTEANEIPNTIASRCQHFTFRSVDFADLMNRLREIATAEGITVDDDALAVIAQAGEGSVRDSLSALDQAIACCGATVQVETVRNLLGLFSTESLRTVAEAVIAQDGSRMLEVVAELESNGKSLLHFCRELTRYWRDLLVAKISGKPTRLIAASEQQQRALFETATQFSEEDLTRYLNLSLDLYKAMQTSLQPRLHLEVGLVKLVHAARLKSIEQAIAEMDNAPGSDSGSGVGRGVVRTAVTRTAAPRPSAFQARPTAAEQTPSEPPSAERVTGAADEPPGDLRHILYSALCKAGMQHSADALQHAEVARKGADLVIRAPKSYMLLFKDPAIERIAAQLLGRPVRLKLETAENFAAAPDGEGSVPQDGLRERALSHPGVKRFQEIFPGAQVRSVRNLNE